jgi:hypothetical protein
MPDITYKRAIELMEADVGEELVGLNVDEGTCFGFNLVAASVWRSLSSPKTFDQLREELLDEFDVSAEQCAGELKELLDDLTAKGLVEKAP